MSAPAAQKDLIINHNREVSHALMQRLSEAVATIYGCVKHQMRAAPDRECLTL
jgi:hypothetical protein